MKKTINLVALIVMLSVNVLTPISYAQEAPEVMEETHQIVSEEEQESWEEGWEESASQVEDGFLLVEEGSVTVEDQPEIISEDTTPSLINMVEEVVSDFTQENIMAEEDIKAEENTETDNGTWMDVDSNDSLTMWSYDEEFLDVTDEIEQDGTIIYEDWLIKVSNWEKEIWIRDRNVWADNVRWSWNYYFWWNNVWLSYSELDIEDGDINTENYTRFWSNYNNDETWWEERSSMVNPCDENNGEYLPTADEWYELMELWAGIKWYVLDEYWQLVSQNEWQKIDNWKWVVILCLLMM